MESKPCAQAELDFDLASVEWAAVDREVMSLESIEPHGDNGAHFSWSEQVNAAREKRMKAVLFMGEKAQAVQKCMESNNAPVED